MSSMSRTPGSRSHFIASQHSSHAARYPSPELGATTKALESRSWTFAIDRPALINRPRSLGELSQVSRTSSTVDLGKQYKNWSTARVEEARLRTEFNASESRWRRAKQTYQRTKKQYEKAIDPSKTSVDPFSNTLVNLRELFELDRAYLETQAVEVTRRRKTLEEVQRNLQNNETLFMEAARRTMQPDPFRTLSPTVISPEVSMMPQNGNGRLGPQLDNRLTKLYEKEAQANIFGERLADLEYDYNAALDSREYRRDHDEPLSTTDEQFEATIEHERVEILQDLDKATKEVEEMKAICDAAGLDVEAHRSNVANHNDIALTDAQFARHEEYRLLFDESTSLMPQAAFEDAEFVEKPPSDHGSDTFVESVHESQPDDRLNQWFESLTA
ncbi:hypothetical protein MBLNU13_g10407t1 [Cladosporium sp. NU13]